jgi:hypothetical protein
MPLSPLVSLPLSLLLALAGLQPAAARLMVVGTPHLASLQPVPTAPARAEAVAHLARFRPTLVCIEALPGDRVATYARDPARHRDLLATFAGPAVRLAPDAQLRLGLDAAAARDAAHALTRQPGPLDDAARWRLIGLQLAAHEPWSAALNWRALPADARAEGERRLGRTAVAALDGLLASDNEIATLAIPLAAQFGHRRLCHADPIIDEVAVGALAADLMPLMQDPAVGAGIAAFNSAQAREWRAGERDGLVRLLAWANGPDFAAGDRRTQWELFAAGPGANRAGPRRLALWHARNADIAAHVHRAMAGEDGERTLLLIGAAHRPFLEATFAAQPWLELVPAGTVLSSAPANPRH